MRKKFSSLRKWALLPFSTFFVTVGYSQYCSVGITYDVEPITRVQFVSIDNVTPGTVNASPVQEDYTSISTSVVPGATYPITLSGNTAGNWVNYFRVYIDWDGDQTFDDPGESYDIGTITNCTNCSVSGSIAVPAAPPVTTTRMRVVKKYNGYGTSCETLGFGQAEDYTININAAPCAGVPAGGTAAASAANICPSANFSVGVTGAATGTGLSYQWQSSPDGLVWTDIAGAINAGYSSTQTVATSYRRRIICSAGPDTSYSTTATVGMVPFYNCYCTSNSTNTGDEDIVLVQLGTLNNTSVADCDTYTDFTGLTATNLIQDLSYNVRVDVGDCSPPYYYDHGVAVFIDYNHNGLFTDAGERVYANPIQANAPVVTHAGSFVVPGSALPGITRMRVIAAEGWDGDDIIPCGGSYGYGETEDYLVNILPPPADEAGVLAITKPEIAACSLGNELWVDVQNMGTNDLTQVIFTVKVNGISIPVSNPWTGNVPAQTNAEILVPISYTLADGDSITVEVSMPNGVAEDSLFDFNNLISRRVWAGLSGVKTIDAAGSGANNYLTMDAALEAVELRGVCDTVNFHIATGNYTAQHIFVPYPGAGAGKLAVFESATGNAADVVFAKNNTGAADNYIFRFDAGDGYMLSNLTAIAEGTGYSTVIDIRNGADYLTFEGNTFVGDTAASYNTGDFDRIVISSAQGNNDSYTVLRNNKIQGGNRAINLGGATGGYENGVVLEGNTIEKFGFLGVILGNSSAFTVNNNVFRPRTTQTQDVFSIYAVGTIDGGSISGNDLQTNRTGSGIFLSNAKGGAADVWVSNNFIYAGDTNAAALSRGITIEDVNSSDIVIANNSISIASDNNASAGIGVEDGSQIRFYNNNIGAFGASPALRVEKSYSVTVSDYNNLFGAMLSNYLGATSATLANVQSVTGREAYSVSVNPGFNGMDLHTCAPGLNGVAYSLAGIIDDFDGNARSASSDIGADEFVGDANGLLSGDDFLKCPAVSVTLGNAPIDGVTYAWTPSGSTSEISVTAAGTYIVTATSACGSFSDTAVVANKPLPNANFTASQVGLASVFNNTSTNGTSYSWDFGDGNTSTEVSPSHVYSTGGTYSATLTVTNECGSDTHGPIPVNVFAAGIEDTQGNLEVSLFPNPTDGQFTVSMSGLANEATVLSVIDVTGKVVLTHNVPAGTNQVTLDATVFASGVYSVKISNGEFNKVIRLVRK